MATNTHIPPRGPRGTTIVRLVIAALATALGGYLYGASAKPVDVRTRIEPLGRISASNTRPYAYGWPVKPFDRPHPVRGSFGDPRGIFTGPPTLSTLLHGGGTFQFHFGIDISAPDGTAVYPVESGTVQVVRPDWVQVDVGGGRAFQYWHIQPEVSAGEHVDANTTVLGHILRDAGHVHLTELAGLERVNPLAPGHIGPYEDTTTPRVGPITFRTTDAGRDQMPEFLRGRVVMITSAVDYPSVRVRGTWRDLPVVPALISWRIQRADTGRVVVPTHIAFDVRRTIPAPTEFWRFYARGTHENMCVFGKHYSYMQPGSYLFKLTPYGFDTRTLRDGVYELIVTATDIAGNHDSAMQRFSIHNRPGWLGP